MATQFDVVLVPFPDTGGFSSQIRPALVVQNDGLNTGIAQVIVAAITSNTDRATGTAYRIALDVNASEGKQVGVLTDSVVLLDNLATVPTDALLRVIGMVSDVAVVAGLCAVFDL